MMEHAILAIELIALISGALALTIWYFYTLPKKRRPAEMSAPFTKATGDR